MSFFLRLTACLVMIGGSGLLPAVRADDVYYTTHSIYDKELVLNLPAKVEGRAFVMSGPAVEVLGITCDGKQLMPTEVEPFALRMDASEYPFPVDAIIYRYSAEAFLTPVWANAKIRSGALLRYSVPKNVKEVIVKYVIHRPDGTITGQSALVSREINDLLEINPSRAKRPSGPKTKK